MLKKKIDTSVESADKGIGASETKAGASSRVGEQSSNASTGGTAAYVFSPISLPPSLPSLPCKYLNTQRNEPLMTSCLCFIASLGVCGFTLMSLTLFVK